MKLLLRVLGDGGGAGAQAPALGVAEATQGGDQRAARRRGGEKKPVIFQLLWVWLCCTVTRDVTISKNMIIPQEQVHSTIFITTGFFSKTNKELEKRAINVY